MAAPFRIYRIVCSTPPDLETERLAFESTLASFGERVTFPEQVLFPCASFRESFDANRHRPAAEANVRMCDFFVHIFSSAWPGPPFHAFIDLAQTCMADPSQPMRQVVVLFKNFAEADDKVRSFRDTLALGGKCELRDFHDPAELDRLLPEIFASWWEAVQARP
jgi:hypothetical protein